MNLISKAIQHAGGVTRLAQACNVTYQAVRRWEAAGRLPRKELTGETQYARAIARIVNGRVSAKALLDQTRKAWRDAA